MRILDNNRKVDFDTVVCLGNFDGIHVGHQKIISKLKEAAKSRGLTSVMLTFKFHPENYLNNANIVKLITSEEIKFELLSDLGIDLLYLHEFDDKTKNLAPEEFVINILVKKLNAKVLVAGFNYRFGKDRAGDVDLLIKLGNEFGIEVIIIPPVMFDNKIVSSTVIREYLKKGEIEKVNKLLDRKYAIYGRIVEGKKRGRELGFPTANIVPIPEIKYPEKGVYATKTYFDDKYDISVTNIGINPTLGGNSVVIETHIIDHLVELYNKYIKIEFYQKIRDEKSFKNIVGLRKQIHKDIEYTINYFKGGSLNE